MNDYIESLNWSLITSFWLMDFSLSFLSCLYPLHFGCPVVLLPADIIRIPSCCAGCELTSVCDVFMNMYHQMNIDVYLSDVMPAGLFTLRKDIHWIYFTLCCLQLVFDCTCESPVPSGINCHFIPFEVSFYCEDEEKMDVWWRDE